MKLQSRIQSRSRTARGSGTHGSLAWIVVAADSTDVWNGDRSRPEDAFDYFAGGKVVKVKREGYEEPIAIPKAGKAVIESAIELQ